jgi:UDP-N-acetylglucosamine/UDP-N-acetylgalactosamine diphosphorylase
MTRDQLLATLQPHGQEHLLAFWDTLAPAERDSLARQIEAIDFGLIGRLFEGRDRQGNFGELAARAEPPRAIRLGSIRHTPCAARLGTRRVPDTYCGGTRRVPDTSAARGIEALGGGHVGTILVAGGQGTRLGFDRPKGMFPVGPLSHKSLFQILFEKIVAARRRYGVPIPLYLMTGPATHDQTAAFLVEHDYFGLPAQDVFFFCQGTMPAVDAATGRVLLEAPGRIAASPDGHGGMLAALRQSGGLDDIRRRGIRHLFYFQVDNPLVDVCQPEFIGHHLLAGSELTTQVVAKHDPLERVGNVVQVDGRAMVIEYSDLPDEAARRRNPDGSLTIWAGSIAVHIIAADLLERTAAAAGGLPFHLARKKVPYVDASGRRIEPAEPNAIKFERFIFDLMPLARNAIVVEVDPAEAFAPLKNEPGAKADTAEHVRAALTALHRNWLRQAGVEVADNVPVEISPLFALDVDELRTKLPPGTRITEPTYLGQP